MNVSCCRPRAAAVCLIALVWLAPLGFECPARGDVHPVAPAFSSLQGAAYTIYLDFSGFNFSGNWDNGSSVPGSTPAYTVDGNANAFSALEVANIQNIWSRVAEKYAPFNINVTTVDPAVAALQAGTDLARQNYYDSQSLMMHTVIGGSGGWDPGAGGVSQISVTDHSVNGSNGAHTDFVFSAQAPSNLQFIGEGSAHENGHGLGLHHQSVYSGNTLVSEYSPGTGSGPGTLAPIMGVSYSAGRGTWHRGDSNIAPLGPSLQNDVFQIMGNNQMTVVNDGIGHSLAAASSIPLSPNHATVDAASAKGIIVPATPRTPLPDGVANYTTDFWAFHTGTGLVSFTAHAGRESISTGVSDPGATLDSTLVLLDTVGNIITTSATSSLDETISMSLAAGTYYLEVLSAGDTSGLGYFDMGSYFLTGSLIAVPEPATWLLAAMGLAALIGSGVRQRPLRLPPVLNAWRGAPRRGGSATALRGRPPAAHPRPGSSARCLPGPGG